VLSKRVTRKQYARSAGRICTRPLCRVGRIIDLSYALVAYRSSSANAVLLLPEPLSAQQQYFGCGDVPRVHDRFHLSIAEAHQMHLAHYGEWYGADHVVASLGGKGAALFNSKLHLIAENLDASNLRVQMNGRSQMICEPMRQLIHSPRNFVET